MVNAHTNTPVISSINANTFNPIYNEVNSTPLLQKDNKSYDVASINRLNLTEQRDSNNTMGARKRSTVPIDWVR